MTILKEVLDILRPLEIMTWEISGEKFVTISNVIPLISCAQECYGSLIPKTEIGNKLQTILLAEFTKRFGQIEKSYLLAEATLLDPRFKQLHFTDPLACAFSIKNLKRQINIKNNIPQQNNQSETNINFTNPDVKPSFDLWEHHHKKLMSSRQEKEENGTCDETVQYLQMPNTQQ